MDYQTIEAIRAFLAAELAARAALVEQPRVLTESGAYPMPEPCLAGQLVARVAGGHSVVILDTEYRTALLYQSRRITLALDALQYPPLDWDECSVVAAALSPFLATSLFVETNAWQMLSLPYCRWQSGQRVAWLQGLIAALITW